MAVWMQLLYFIPGGNIAKCTRFKDGSIRLIQILTKLFGIETFGSKFPFPGESEGLFLFGGEIDAMDRNQPGGFVSYYQQ